MMTRYPSDFLVTMEDNRNDDALQLFLNNSNDEKVCKIVASLGHHQCTLCASEITKESAISNVEMRDIFPDISSIHTRTLVLSCAKCKRPAAIYIDSRWFNLEDALRTEDASKVGLKQVERFGERLALFVLNDLIYARMGDDEVTTLPVSSGERGKILWSDQVAVGFYTWKEKGDVFSLHLPRRYQLPVVDLIFVRAEFRRRGYGAQILRDVVETLGVVGEEDVGFSSPISAPMLQVIRKFLVNDERYRKHMWKVEDVGDEDGGRQLIWYLIK